MSLVGGVASGWLRGNPGSTSSTDGISWSLGGSFLYKLIADVFFNVTNNTGTRYGTKIYTMTATSGWVSQSEIATSGGQILITCWCESDSAGIPRAEEKSRMSLRTITVVPLFVGLILAACTDEVPSEPTPTFCDGIDSTIGGCDEDLPEFTATDCPGIGEEFGALLDERTRAVLSGPADVDGEARSVRLKHVMALLGILANQHLRELDLRASCDAPEFLAAAETEFSDELRESVGDALFDGSPPSTYEEWLAEVGRSVSVIDTEE